MNLSRISIEARLRTPWEAVDLGFVLARQWWKPLFLSWFIPSAILYSVLSIVLYQYNWLAILIVWWLKPLWDRAPLYIASRALFGESTPWRDLLRILPSLYNREIFPWLTWRRFSLTRSFDMPVTVLEKLNGHQRQARLRVLHHTSANAATGLSLVCTHLEALISIGAIALFGLMIPEELNIDFLGLLMDENDVVTHISNLLSFIAMSLIAPFYTIAGFTLYISRRIELEAWDIEIRFRHLASQHNPSPVKAENNGRKIATNLLTIILSLCFFVTLLMPLSSYAEHSIDSSKESLPASIDSNTLDKHSDVETPLQAKALIDNILTGDDFHKNDSSKSWRLKKRNSDDPEAELLPEWIIKIIEFFENHQSVFDLIKSIASDSARLIAFILWVLAISLTIYFIYRYRDYLRQFIPYQSNAKELISNPSALFGLDVSHESLPANIPEQVQRLWYGNEYRAALSLLYRATLSTLIHKKGFTFYDGYTESECQAVVKQAGDDQLGGFMTQLTYCWQQLAYGHRLPDSQQIDLLCQHWRELFDDEEAHE